VVTRSRVDCCYRLRPGIRGTGRPRVRCRCNGRGQEVRLKTVATRASSDPEQRKESQTLPAVGKIAELDAYAPRTEANRSLFAPCRRQLSMP